MTDPSILARLARAEQARNDLAEDLDPRLLAMFRWLELICLWCVQRAGEVDVGLTQAVMVSGATEKEVGLAWMTACRKITAAGLSNGPGCHG